MRQSSEGPVKYVGTHPPGSDDMGSLRFGISDKYPGDVDVEVPGTILRDVPLYSVCSCFEQVPLSGSSPLLFD